MGIPPQGSGPRHPFGRRAFASGVGIGVFALILSVVMLLSDDRDVRAAGIATLVTASVCAVTVALLMLAERAARRRRR